MQQGNARQPLQACLDAQVKIQQLHVRLADPRPDALDRLHGELQEIASLLESLTTDQGLQLNPLAASALVQIRRSAQALNFQIDYASNLCSGWIQLRLGAGYTQQGLPVLLMAEPGSSFEG